MSIDVSRKEPHQSGRRGIQRLLLLLGVLGLLGPAGARADAPSPSADARLTREQVLHAIARAGNAPADLSGRNLSKLDLSGVDFKGANLTASVMNGSNLSGANLSRCNLTVSFAEDANLTNADLREAVMF
ncbi:MAG: pentapeptide repeat-containing protein, partial [Burkholderiales bacterium]